MSTSARVRVAIALLSLAACASPTAVPDAPPGATQTTVAPGLAAADAEAPGKLPPVVIQAEVRRQHAVFRKCYEAGLVRNPRLVGRVEIRFVIGRDGGTPVADVRASPAAGQPGLEDTDVRKCIQARALEMHFPPPVGGIVTVSYPFVLTPDMASPGEARGAAPTVTHLQGGCEQAKEAHLKRCAATPGACPELDEASRPGAGAYGAVLNQGTYLRGCAVPPTMAIKICAAVRDGRASAVTVETSPGDDAVGSCIGRAVQALSFPSSPGLDLARTTFDAQ